MTRLVSQRSSTYKVQDKHLLPPPNVFDTTSSWRAKYDNIIEFLNYLPLDGVTFFPRIVVEFRKFSFVMNNCSPVLLGCGGSSRVFLVQSEKGGKYALKIFLKASRVYLSSVIKEARYMIIGNNAKVGPRFYGLFPLVSDDNYLGWGIAMEFLGNHESGFRMELAGLANSDRRRLGRKESPRVSRVQWLKMMLEITKQLQNLHSEGLLLNDLSPDNVLVTTEYGEYLPWIIDFGSATLVHCNCRRDPKMYENDIVFLCVMMQGIDFVLESSIFHDVLSHVHSKPDIPSIECALSLDIKKY